MQTLNMSKKSVSFMENQNSLVILIDKSQMNDTQIESAKRFFLIDYYDLSHISFVTDEEQKEIEEILKNPDCHEFVSKSIIEV